MLAVLRILAGRMHSEEFQLYRLIVVSGLWIVDLWEFET